MYIRYIYIIFKYEIYKYEKFSSVKLNIHRNLGTGPELANKTKSEFPTD